MGADTRREKKHNFVVKIKTAISESSNQKDLKGKVKIKMNGCFLSLDKMTPQQHTNIYTSSLLHAHVCINNFVQPTGLNKTGLKVSEFRYYCYYVHILL